MTVYLIAYDLNSPGQLHGAMIDELRSVDSFHAQKSFWFVDVPQTARQLRNALQTYLDGNDTLFVQVVVSGCWASTNMDAAAKWLAARGVT